MDVLAEIEAIMEEIRNAKPVPFSASAMINRQELLERLEMIRQNAPEELKQARWVMRDREDLLGKTHQEAERLLSEARAERDRVVSRTEIVAEAHRESDRIIEDARNKARKIQLEAEDYIDAKLASFEVILQKTQQAVARGRESLRGKPEGEELGEEIDTSDGDITPPGGVRLRRRTP